MTEQQPVVLVVDDNLLVRSMVEATLRRKYSVRAAASVEEALERCREATPDLVLLDVHLAGGESGLTICNQIRETVQPAPPIVFLTGDMDPELAERCQTAGGRDVLHKPFSPLELLQRIARLLSPD
ncbi:MAG: response regulator [Planctomycetota bacterium]